MAKMILKFIVVWARSAMLEYSFDDLHFFLIPTEHKHLIKIIIIYLDKKTQTWLQYDLPFIA